MTSRRRPPALPPPSAADEFDDKTVVDDAPLPDEDTPVEPPLCVECGGIVFVDAADLLSAYPFDRCLRSWDGKRWHWCHKLKKSVTYYP